MRIYKKKNKFILLLFTVTLFLGILTRNILSLDSFSTEKDQNTINNIKDPFASNNNMINITTPENRTYTKPMSGYYPATYGFENDEVGSDPAEWDVYEGAGYVDLKDEMNNHKRVVEMYDNTNANHDELHRSFSLQTYGTVEFWMMSDDVWKALTIILLDDTATSVWGNCIGWLQIYQNKIRYEDNIGWDDTSKIVYDNTWYHIKIEFECSTGNYHGLAQHTWRFYVDGEEFGDFPFKNNIDNVSQAYFCTRGADYNYRCYIDAVGFSWDPNYNIGDNRNEGLLLSFDNSTTLDWIGYSLDGQTNKTILGNTTIPIPEKGAHNIQISGNNTLGALYQSDIRYFSIQDITIITPENKTYTEPMSGYYPATFGFESEDTYTSGTDINFVDITGNEIQQIIPNFTGHKKVLELIDSSNSLYSLAQGNFAEQEYGTVEFWLSTSDAAKVSGAYLGHSVDGQGIILKIDDDKFSRYFNGWVDIGKAATDDIWYHIRIDFECGSGNYSGLSADKWQIWIDGELFGSYDYRQSFNRDDLDYLYFRTFEPDSSYSSYIDAIGYSWDPNYNIGDNLDEGLLLSFNTIFTPDWMGYSLDGLANKTILGNTTFPLPENGGHNIQVFGNNSLGTMYHSDIRNFFVSRNNTNKPLLSNGKVTPISGNQGTLFNFSVIYTDIDNNAPSYVNVIINGTPYEMVKVYDSDNSYNNGVLYYYLKYLSASTYNYSYYFNCSDGVFFNSTGIFNNLEVKSTNNYKPRLIYPRVTPGNGGDFTLFNFTVLYVDEDNNLPVQVNITINSLIYTMQPVDIFDNIALDGIQFFCNTTLDFSLYQFQINCSDGLFTNSTGWINGPEVSPLFNIDPVTLLSPSYNANFASGWVNFSWSSVDAPFGTVNYTIQISNNTDFSHIIYELRNIIETTGVSNIFIFIDSQSNPYYWRIRPTYGIFNGSWSNYFMFYTFSNINAPLLTSSTNIPNSGTEHTIFEFTVTYIDSDNNAPSYVKILINNIAFYMEKQNPSDNNYADGCVYQYSTLLDPSPNPYYYSFECSDGTYLNTTSVFIGPSVHLENPPDGGEAGQNNLNSENIFNSILIIGIGLGIIIPFIVFTEFKIKKLKRTPEVLPKKEHKFKKH